VVDTKAMSSEEKLIQAVIAGDVDATKSALDQGAQINVADDDGWHPLHIAVQKQNVQFIRWFLERPEINVNARNKWGSTPLMLAASSGNLDSVECLLRHPMIRVNLQSDYYGRTALIETAVKGHAHVTRCLVSFGADVNLTDKTGRNTALIEAIKNKHTDIAIYLLRTGAIDFANSGQRLQALIWAGRHRDDKLYRELDHAIASFFNRTGGLPLNKSNHNYSPQR